MRKRKGERQLSLPALFAAKPLQYFANRDGELDPVSPLSEYFVSPREHRSADAGALGDQVDTVARTADLPALPAPPTLPALPATAIADHKPGLALTAPATLPAIENGSHSWLLDAWTRPALPATAVAEHAPGLALTAP